MKLHHKPKCSQLPDSSDWRLEHERRVADHAALWLADRFGISIATAKTIAALAGFDGGRSR